MKALNAVYSLVKSINPVLVASPSINTSMIESFGPEEYIEQEMEELVPEFESNAVTLNSYCIP